MENGDGVREGLEGRYPRIWIWIWRYRYQNERGRGRRRRRRRRCDERERDTYEREVMIYETVSLWPGRGTAQQRARCRRAVYSMGTVGWGGGACGEDEWKGAEERGSMMANACVAERM